MQKIVIYSYYISSKSLGIIDVLLIHNVLDNQIADKVAAFRAGGHANVSGATNSGHRNVELAVSKTL
jgi:hypothetical protein